MLNRILQEKGLHSVIQLLEALKPVVDYLNSLTEDKDLFVSASKKFIEKSTQEEKLGFVPSLKKLFKEMDFQEY